MSMILKHNIQNKSSNNKFKKKSSKEKKNCFNYTGT